MSYFIKFSNFFINKQIVWFSNENEQKNQFCDYIEYLNFYQFNETFTKSKTIIIDLSMDIDEIRKGYTKTCKYEISRAKREEIKIESVDLKNKKNIKYFAIYYVKFLKNKNLEHKKWRYYYKLIELYAMNNLIDIRCAKYNNAILCVHYYIVKCGVARLYWAPSIKDKKSDINRKYLGYANRLLHDECIESFKSQGYRIYDFGGYSDLAELEGINNFKLSFSKDIIEVGNKVVALSKKGKVINYFCNKIN